MTYIQKATLKNLIAAGMMLALGYCLQLYGMTSIVGRMSSALQALKLGAYEWTLAQSIVVQMIYQTDIWYWGALSDAFVVWMVITLLLVVGLYRFASSRLAAIATVAVLIGTFSISVPIKLTETLWMQVSGIEAPYPSSKQRDSRHSSEAMAANGEMMSQLESVSDEIMPFNLLSSKFSTLTTVYNTMRLVLVPIIAILIIVMLFGSVRRSRNA